MDVVVVGACNMDLISYSTELPQKGQTIHGTKFKTGFGGKGANQCAMAAKLGGKCAMIAKVGDDAYGRGFKEEFTRLGVNTDYIFTSTECDTGVATCLVDKDANSAIIIISGANLLLSTKDVDSAEELIKRSKVMVCQLESNEDATVEALKLAKKHNVTTIFNPAPRKSNLPEEIYKYCDILCPNETEVSEIPVVTQEEAGQAALTYIDKGCGMVIVTLGAQGCVYVTKEDLQPKHVSCEQVKAVDTTGAGDAFVGSLAYFIARHSDLPLETMIQRASYVATKSVLKEGTQISFPTKDDLPHSMFT